MEKKISKDNSRKTTIVLVAFLILFMCVFYIKGLLCKIDRNLLSESEESLIQENIKKQAEVKELINIDTLSQEFIDNYFEEVSNLDDVERENLLIVISKEMLKNTYGASKVIKAPNNQYLFIYDSIEKKNYAFDKFKKDSDVVSVEENRFFSVETLDEVEEYNSWGIDELGFDNAINTINSLYEDGSDRINDVVVAVIDSGLEVGVFEDKYKNKLDGTYDIVKKSEEITDKSGHGTHVAGTVAEATPSNVKIFAIKVRNDNKAGTNKEYDTVSLNDAIIYAISENVDVINFSIGGYYSSGIEISLYQSIETAKMENIVFVASAGNDNTDNYHIPSDYDNAISVTGVDSNLEKGFFSNYGKYVDFSAPGYRINSLSNNGGIAEKTGTSMSAPHVASAVAILKSFNKNLTLDDTISLLKKYAIDIGDNGWDEKYGYGVVNFNDVAFCIEDTYANCDEFNVFQKDNIEGLKTIRIETSDVFVPEYNYGNDTNLFNLELNLYYTEDDYYTKTLSQLMDYIEIIGYDPYNVGRQDVTIKYNNFETTLTVDNSKMLPGWGFKENETGDDIILTEFYYNANSTLSETYASTIYPQVIRIPNEINGKPVVELGDNLFYEQVSGYIGSLKRIYISPGIKKIGSKVFGMHLPFSLYVYIGPLEIVFPDTIEELTIDDNVFQTVYEENGKEKYIKRENIVFYLYKDTPIYQYAVDNNINYLYLDQINVELSKNEYRVFDKINPNDLLINVSYSGNIDSISETVNNFEIKYNNGNNSFALGDTSFIVSFDTSVGHHVEQEVLVTVSKAIPEYVIPIGLEAKLNQKLSDVLLPDNFEWMDETQLLTEAGNKSYKARYVSDDTDNYEIVDNIEIPVLVRKEVVVPTIEIEDKIYDGTTFVNLDAVSVTNFENIDYTIEGVELSSTDAGNTTAIVKIKLSDNTFLNYELENGEQEQEFNVNVKILPQKIRKPLVADKKYIYNGQEQEFELDGYDEKTMSIFNNYRKDAGEQIIKVLLENSNYIWEDGSDDSVNFTFKIDKAVLNVDYESLDNSVTYDGNKHGIILNIKNSDVVKVKYMDNLGKYSLDEMPLYSDAGTYVIKYKLYIDDNYTEIFEEQTLKIGKFVILNNSIDYEGVFDGNEHSIILNLNVENYDIKYSVNNKNYNLSSMPKFKNVGEYIVNYKVTCDNCEDLFGSNKVNIYGIKGFDSTLRVIDNIFVVKNNSFSNISDKVFTYFKTVSFTHLDKNKVKVNSDISKTGDIIEIFINNLKKYEYHLSIVGDVNSDGKISSADYVKIKKHIMESEVIKDKIYFYSADVNNDNKISSADYVKIKKYIMDGESI